MVLFGRCSSSAPKVEESPPSSKEPSKEEIPASSGSSSGEGADRWGYDLYPERKGEKYKPSWSRIMFLGEGRENIDKMKCERNVVSCAQKSPIVKLMMTALKSSGCEIDLRRHISCEVCDVSVSGGYDPVMNQIVVCQNIARKEGVVQGVLAHEMIHMFDYCRHKLDFQNLKHLACTEIRAANLTHCSFMSAWTQGDASPVRVREQHRECVRTKAIASVLAVRQVSHDEAAKIVDSVFKKCYADLEPIGRRVKRNSMDMYRAFNEGPLYGYE